jgi:hypothetical protein
MEMPSAATVNATTKKRGEKQPIELSYLRDTASAFHAE